MGDVRKVTELILKYKSKEAITKEIKDDLKLIGMDSYATALWWKRNLSNLFYSNSG